MYEFERTSYNLISANEAKELSTTQHKIYLYLEYMRKLDEKIKLNAEKRGDSDFIVNYPNSLIADKVINDIKAKGYIVKINESPKLRSLLISIPKLKDDNCE